MKNLFVLLMIGSLNIVLFSNHASAQKNEPFTTYTFSALAMSTVNTVEATTVNGDLKVIGDAVLQTAVEMFVSGNSPAIRNKKWSDAEIKQELDKTFDIEVKVVGEKILIAAKQKPNVKNASFNITFKITVPKQMNTDLETTNGSVQISNLTGSQKLKTVNGSLKIENTSGKITGNTVNGSITVTNSNDDINLSTVNGSISETGCSGNINLKTVNGKVNRR